MDVPLIHEISERDQLVLAIEKLQSQLTQLQDHAEDIAGERDNLAGLYSQVTNELQILRGESQKASASVKSPSLIPSRPVSVEPLGHSTTTERAPEKERIKELEKLVDQLNRDLKKTVLSQRETGASANEVLSQLESEIEV